MIKLLVFDVDGTLTDGKVYYTQSGEEIKAFNIHDGLAIHVWNKLIQHQSAIITGRESPIVAQRANELGIKHVFMGVHNKAKILKSLLQELHLDEDEVACIGDDLNDLGMFKISSFAYMPKDGAKDLEKYAYKKLQACGGHGAVREMIEDVLKLNGDRGLEEYFS